MLRSKRRRYIVRAAVFAALAGLVWAVFASPLFHFRKVLVVGARHTTPAQVAEVADLSEDDNLLLLSTGPVVARVETLPWVLRAEIERKLPGTVRVRVVERTPALVLSLGAARWTVDEYGRVLTAGTARSGLPVLAGLEVRAIEPGLALRTREARAALAVWRSLPRSLSRDVEGVFAPTIERITLSLGTGILVRYGAAERMPAKATVIKALLGRLAAEHRTAAYIDVRVPGRPAVSDAPALAAGGGDRAPTGSAGAARP